MKKREKIPTEEREIKTDLKSVGSSSEAEAGFEVQLR